MRKIHALLIIGLGIFLQQCDCQRTEAPQLDPKANTTDSIFSDEGVLLKVKNYGDDSLHYSFTTFYPSGNIERTGQKIVVEGVQVPGGQHFFYNQEGVMTKRITYHYPEEAAKPVQIQEELSFHEDGSTPKRSALYRACIGCDREPCGDWLDFTEEGSKKGAVIYDTPCE
jgi:hypothetical protein